MCVVMKTKYLAVKKVHSTKQILSEAGLLKNLDTPVPTPLLDGIFQSWFLIH